MANGVKVHSNIVKMHKLAIQSTGSIVFYPTSRVEVFDSAVIVSSKGDIDLQGPFNQPYPNQNSCKLENVNIQQYRCQSITNTSSWTGDWADAGLIAVSGRSVTVQGEVRGTGIVLCGDKIEIPPNGKVNSSGYGCPMNYGNGCGCSSGGGGGLGGAGSLASKKTGTVSVDVSCDSTNVCEGRVHSEQNAGYKGEISQYDLLSLTVGSGGGSVEYSPYAGRGGGVLVLEATTSLIVNGKVSANGQDAYVEPLPTTVYGSGSGGTIVIRTPRLEGGGLVHADGGQNKFSNSTYEGGIGGGGRVIFAADPFYTYKFGGTFSLGLGNMSTTGILYPPACPAGQNNSQDKDGRLQTCTACPVGTYKVQADNTQCEPCTNGPLNSKYTKEEQATDQCAFECKDGYKDVKGKCLDSFEQFLDSIGGYPILGAVGSSVTLLLFAPFIILKNVMAYRAHRVLIKQDDSKIKMKKTKKTGGIGDFFSNADSVNVVDLVSETEMNPVIKHADGSNSSNSTKDTSGGGITSTEKVVDPSLLSSSPSRDSFNNLNNLSHLFSASTRALNTVESDKSEKSDFKEMQYQYCMTDRDISVHAERVYLLGTNSPRQLGLGGSWRWSVRCPENLKHMVDPVAYAQLARSVTAGVAWKMLSLEHLAMWLTHILLPPHGQQLVVSVSTYCAH